MSSNYLKKHILALFKKAASTKAKKFLLFLQEVLFLSLATQFRLYSL